MMPEHTSDTSLARAGAERIEELSGVVVPEYRWPVVFGELHRLGRDHDPEDALRQLEAGEPGVREALLKAVTIPETYLFRHPAHFRVLHRLATERAGRGLTTRVLSVGCSTGEEAWSAAATLASVAVPAGLRHRVTGWDLSATRLDQARAARYGPWSTRIGLLEYGDQFVSEGPMVRPTTAVRDMVSFEQVNVVAAPPKSGQSFDAILLRNVAIYWRPPTVEAVWRRLAELLDPDGLFLVGPSDPVELPLEAWEQVILNGARCYRRRADGADLPLVGRGDAATPAAPVAPPRHDASSATARRRQPAAPARPTPVVPPSAAGAAADPAHTTDTTLLEEVRTLADAGRYREALALLENGVGTGTVAGRSWRGVLHLALENIDEAIRLFRQCVFLEPSEIAHRRWLAAAYEAAGMAEDASREVRNIEELDGP